MKKVRILSIEGGGIRGILSASFLSDLEQKLKEKSNDFNSCISDYFDLIVGTSTGGILSCLFLLDDGYKRPKYKAEEIVSLYRNLGKQVFERSLYDIVTKVDGIVDEKYDASNLENAIKEIFGDSKMSHLLKPAMVTSYDIKGRKAFFFRTEKCNEDQKDHLIVDALRSTASAPSYFEPLEYSNQEDLMVLIDGGVFSSNPSMTAYAEARGMRFSEIEKIACDIDLPEADDMMLLSVGTGVDNKEYTFESSKSWGQAQWAVPLIRILLSANAETTNHYLKQIFNTTNDPQSYLRVNINLPSEKCTIDDTDDDYLDFLISQGKQMFSNYENQLDHFVDKLLSSRSSKTLA